MPVWHALRAYYFYGAGLSGTTPGITARAFATMFTPPPFCLKSDNGPPARYATPLLPPRYDARHEAACRRPLNSAISAFQHDNFKKKFLYGSFRGRSAAEEAHSAHMPMHADHSPQDARSLSPEAASLSLLSPFYSRRELAAFTRRKYFTRRWLAAARGCRPRRHSVGAATANEMALYRTDGECRCRHRGHRARDAAPHLLSRHAPTGNVTPRQLPTEVLSPLLMA